VQNKYLSLAASADRPHCALVLTNRATSRLSCPASCGASS